jgi:hypothetical protein
MRADIGGGDCEVHLQLLAFVRCRTDTVAVVVDIMLRGDFCDPDSWWAKTQGCGGLAARDGEVHLCGFFEWLLIGRFLQRIGKTKLATNQNQRQGQITARVFGALRENVRDGCLTAPQFLREQDLSQFGQSEDFGEVVFPVHGEIVTGNRYPCKPFLPDDRYLFWLSSKNGY